MYSLRKRLDDEHFSLIVARVDMFEQRDTRNQSNVAVWEWNGKNRAADRRGGSHLIMDMDMDMSPTFLLL